jgi:hypothetical protein
MMRWGDTPYPTTFFPNATRLAEAKVLNLHPDRPVSVDYRLPPPLTPRSIDGQVVDARGRAAPGIDIELHDADVPHARESSPSAVGRATTDGSGRFSVTGFVGRRYVVKARNRRNGAREVSVAVPAAPPTAGRFLITMPES